MLGHTTPTDMTGHPALTMPAAEAEGLPVGLMLVSPRWSDDRLLALAATYERRYGWSPSSAQGRHAQPSK
jgi:amidase